MSLLFESIACINGQLQNLTYHQERVNRSQDQLLNLDDHPSLKSIEIPEQAKNGLWKCRVTYAEKIEQIKFTPYKPSQAKTFKLVEADITYAQKIEDRSQLNLLFERRGNCDDIIIINNGLVSDSSIGNLIFSKGQTWVTPSTPLLEGTMRAMLLAQGSLTEELIRPDDLIDYDSFMMINALNPFDESRALGIRNIID